MPNAEMVKAKLNGSYEIILPKHRAERPEWYTESGWEKKRLEHIHRTIKKGDFVYYVGAEEGEMCALIAQWGAKVFMFEPNEKVWPNIKAIWEANKLEEPFLYKGFAANKTTGTEVNLGFKSIDGPVIHDHGFKELRDPGKIATVRIDDLPYRPDMITMDVEGSEWEVLQGAEKTIEQFKPRIYLSLHPEFLIDQYGKYSYEVRRWIIDKGYNEELLDYQHEVHFVYEPIK